MANQKKQLPIIKNSPYPLNFMKLMNIISLIKYLTYREIATRYKQSFLGFFWVLLNPILQMVIMSFVFSSILRFSHLGVPYPIFLYAGLLPWIFFTNSLHSSTNILVENSALIKKIYFPREVLVVSTILAKVVDFFFMLSVFFLLMIFYQIPFTFYILFFIPIFLLQFIFTFSLGLFLSWTNLFYRDIQYLVNLLLTLWFYLTPVIYPVEFFPEKYRFIFKLNPLSVFINAYRQVLLGGDLPKWESLSIAAFLSINFFILSYFIFKKMEKDLVDIV